MENPAKQFIRIDDILLCKIVGKKGVPLLNEGGDGRILSTFPLEEKEKRIPKISQPHHHAHLRHTPGQCTDFAAMERQKTI